MLKSTTFRVAVAVCIPVPTVPITAKEELPAKAPDVVSVKVAVPEPVIEVGLNKAVTPAGNVPVVNATVEWNPSMGVTVTV
jgi:hypothetical protein